MFMLAALFFLRLPGVQCGYSVTYSSTRVCGLRGATVVLPCSYEYPWKSRGDTFTGGGWYHEQKDRVREHSNSEYPNCSLTIERLSNDLSGVYHFQFYTALHISWIKSASGVMLSVTDLHVREEAVGGNQNLTKLTCSTSCSLGSQYVWYRNGQQLQDKTTASILLDSAKPSEEGSYSCTVRGYKNHSSPAACYPSKQCWSVTYSSTRVCGLKGTSVVLPCTCEYPGNDMYHKGGWYEKQRGRVRGHSDCKYPDCSLNLDKLSDNDAGVYEFQFQTRQHLSWIKGSPDVTVSVTGLQVITPEAVTEGEKVTLTCKTTCSLSNDPTFVWYKTGQPVIYKHTTRNKLHLNPVNSEDAGSYSCAVRGNKNLSSTAVFLNITYKPKTISVSISPNETEEGSFVTLTCSSDANPPVHTYTWYMKSGAESLVRGTGESMSFNVTSDTSGLYYCEAQNELGAQFSREVAVHSQGSEAVAMILPAIITFIIVAVLLVTAGIVYLRKNNAKIAAHGRATNANMESDSGLLYSYLTLRTTTSEPTQRAVSSCDVDVQYASIQIIRCERQKVPLYSTVGKPQTSAQDVDYTSVQFNKGISATRVENDDSVIYSTVNKP